MDLPKASKKRKAINDISNSRKQVKVKGVTNLVMPPAKQSVSTLEEEGFLHNHEEDLEKEYFSEPIEQLNYEGYIKALEKVEEMEMEDFLERRLGFSNKLEDDSPEGLSLPYLSSPSP